MSRITTLALGVIAVLLGIVFEKQNVAFMVSLAFAIAASANFPVLILSLLWKDCTTRGAVIGGSLGPGFVADPDPAVAVGMGGHAGQCGRQCAVPAYTSPALFSMTIAFVSIWFFSITDKSKNAQAERCRLPGTGSPRRDRHWCEQGFVALSIGNV